MRIVNMLNPNGAPSASKPNGDDFVDQLKDGSQGDPIGSNDGSLTQSIDQGYTALRLEHDTVSVSTEGMETASISLPGSSACSDNGEYSSNTAQSRVEMELSTKTRGKEPRDSDVERCQPRKGSSCLGSFIELTSFYLRSSDAGQTWYHGPDSIC